ncbi:hypothetical protein ACPPVO_27495 [Dactylosporangium sp. McL0621]
MRRSMAVLFAILALGTLTTVPGATPDSPVVLHVNAEKDYHDAGETRPE